MREKYRDALLDKCGFDAVTREAKKALLTELTPDVMQATDSDMGKHVYHKPHGMVNIKNQYSKDLSLFYTEDNVRSLFNWRRPLYSNICRFLSQ